MTIDLGSTFCANTRDRLAKVIIPEKPQSELCIYQYRAESVVYGTSIINVNSGLEARGASVTQQVLLFVEISLLLARGTLSRCIFEFSVHEWSIGRNAGDRLHVAHAWMA